MQSETYLQQVSSQNKQIDLDFWRRPEGVAVPDDDLRFLLVPDAVESAAVAEVARQVHDYQAANADSPDQITRGLMVTMGGVLPGILLYDHLVHGCAGGLPGIEFGTVGVSLYKAPGIRYEQPIIRQDISISIAGRTVLLIDDLGDIGGTMKFLNRHLLDAGAHKALKLVLYMKPAAKKNFHPDFYFGETSQDTWIITPRERVETLAKRVPLWRKRGASERECRRRLVDIIGYPEPVVDQYLPDVYTGL